MGGRITTLFQLCRIKAQWEECNFLMHFQLDDLLSNAWLSSPHIDVQTIFHMYFFMRFILRINGSLYKYQIVLHLVKIDCYDIQEHKLNIFNIKCFLRVIALFIPQIYHPLFLTFCLQIYFQQNFFISLLFHLFFPYFNLFVSIFIQSYVNIKLHVSTLYRY